MSPLSSDPPDDVIAEYIWSVLACLSLVHLLEVQFDPDLILGILSCCISSFALLLFAYMASPVLNCLGSVFFGPLSHSFDSKDVFKIVVDFSSSPSSVGCLVVFPVPHSFCS